MKKISIPKDKWIEIYNSIVLLQYFCYEYKNNPDAIKALNQRLNNFCEKHNIIGKEFSIEGGENMISICYLIIVRIIECIVYADIGDGSTRKELFKNIVETAKAMGFTSFDEIVIKHDIKIIKFVDSAVQDEEKLYQLFRHIRHSISHFSYKLERSNNIVNFKSINSRTSIIELDIQIPMHQLMNLTMNFGRWVNNTIHSKKCLS